MSDLNVEDRPPDDHADAPAGAGVVVPYLVVADARRALAWYGAVLGATEVGEALLMPDGRIGHAELRIGGSTLYLADEGPESEVAAPAPGARATVSLVVEVRDVDRTFALARAEGATPERPPADYPYGRNAVVGDPFGHRWIVSSPSPSPSPAQEEQTRHGDVAYVSLWVPDAERASSFFAAVLGWTYLPDGGAETHQVAGRALHHGIHGGHDRSTLFLCFAVDDVDAALDKVTAAGGRAEAPTQEPWGRTAMCTDVEGTAFALFEPPPTGRGPRPAPNGTGHGDVSYLTMEVGHSAPVRAFYGAVLGWRFHPGRVEDGWGPEDVVPMTGLHGGHDVATVVPMYRVDDIHDAVARVRAAGGTATDPEPQPYGLSSQCVDDQGTRFYLGQH